MQRALVVGGTSGLGLELAKLLQQDHDVTITGRKNPNVDGLEFLKLDIGPHVEQVAQELEDLSFQNKPFDLVVYAAGYYQEGTMGELFIKDIVHMTNVGFLAPTILMNRILKRQHKLPGFIAITSTSQWTPRLKEPVYTGVKAGLAMFANSLSLDPNVGKVMVAGPAGMKTPFWDKTQNDTSTMLDPVWVASQIIALYKDGHYKYRFVRITRNPNEVVVAEQR